MNYDKYLSGGVLKNICSGNVLKIIKVSVSEYICNEAPCFQHILLNTFRRMRMKHENYTLSDILL